MNIGITGWRGFIGSHLKDRIENPILFQGDLRNIESAKRFVIECDRIYHLAGRNRAFEGDILINNLIATGNLMLACKLGGVTPEIIFASTMATEFKPDSEYGFTKLIEEEIIKRAKRWCIFRIPNVYGEGFKPFYNSVVATFANQISRGEVPTINNPDVTREFIYIDKLIDYLLVPIFSNTLYPKGETLSIGQVYEYLTSKLGEHENLKRCLDYYKYTQDNLAR